MNRKALSSLAAFVLLSSASAVCAQELTPAAPPAPPAVVAAPPAPASPAAMPHAASAPAPPPSVALAPAPPAPVALAAVAAVPDAPDAPAPPSPAVAPALPPAPPQEPAPAPPAVATTLFVAGNFLGVHTEEVTRDNMQRYGLSGEPRGVGVREVVKESPAEKAGLRERDVIVRFDGEAVTSVRKLTRLIEESAPGHTARVTVLRGGSEQELSATLTRREPFVAASGDGLFNLQTNLLGEEWARNSEQWKRAQEQAQQKWEEMARKHPGLLAGSSRRIGVTTNALGKQLADYFGVTNGVLVSSVEQGSPAEKAGLKAGDVVTEADGQKVEDSDDLTRAISAKQEGEVTLTIVRDRKSRTVRVTPERRAVPQGMFAPGAFRLLETPVAALALPGIQMHPDALVGPRALVTPRVLTAPRVRVAPRARVFGLNDRVL